MLASRVVEVSEEPGEGFILIRARQLAMEVQVRQLKRHLLDRAHSSKIPQM